MKSGAGSSGGAGRTRQKASADTAGSGPQQPRPMKKSGGKGRISHYRGERERWVRENQQMRRQIERLTRQVSDLRALVEHSPDVMCTKDLNLRVVELNSALEKISGLSAEELRGRTTSGIYSRAQAARHESTDARVLNGEELEEETRIMAGDMPDTMRIFKFPLRDPSGRITGLGTIARRVTPPEQTWRMLARERERFRVLVDESPLGVSLIGEDGRYKYINRAFKDLFGYDMEAIPTGEAWFERAYPNPVERGRVVAAWLGDLRTKGKGQARTRVFTVTCADGTRKDIEFRPVTLGSGDQLVIYQDVTQRLRAEEDLRQSQEKYRKVFEASPAWVVLSDLETGLYLEANQAYLTAMDYTRQDLEGKTSLNLNTWEDPRDRGRIVEAIKNHGVIDAFEVTRIGRDGRRIPTLFHGETLEVGGRRLLYSISTDLREAKRAQAEKERLAAQLRQSQQMQAIGTLAGGIAHDFNNILAAIMGYGELALLSAGQGRDNAEPLTKIIGAAERARRLIRQILTFSRRVDVQLKPLDLNGEISRSVALLEATLPKTIDLRLDLAPDLWPVRGDPNQIEQVVLNLGSNASDAMPQGGSLHIETRNLLVDEVFCRQHMEATPGPYVMLSVTDSGMGMDGETCRQVFDPFFTTKEVGKGTGLGLSTVYGVVQAHGGNVTCYSQPGSGTTFRIYLPAQGTSPSLYVGDQMEPDSEPGGQETILVVDDEEALRSVSQEVLEMHGYRVQVASRGEEALELYWNRTGEIDLVVLDLGMPGMGGRRCLKELLAMDPGVKVLVTSGYAQNGLASDLGHDGARGFVGKPFRAQELLQAVRRVLDG